MFLVDAEVEAESYGKERKKEEGGKRQRGMGKSKTQPSALFTVIVT